MGVNSLPKTVTRHCRGCDLNPGPSARPGGAVVRALGLRLRRSRVRLPAVPLSANDLAQVVHTYLPLSPSSIVWYRSRGGDAGVPGLDDGVRSVRICVEFVQSLYVLMDSATGQLFEVKRSIHQRVCVQPRPSAVDMTLPAVAAERRRLLSIAVFCPRGAQQQTRRTPPMLLSIDGTDRLFE